jgi:hypothetical protein
VPLWEPKGTKDVHHICSLPATIWEHGHDKSPVGSTIYIYIRAVQGIFPYTFSGRHFSILKVRNISKQFPKKVAILRR